MIMSEFSQNITLQPGAKAGWKILFFVEVVTFFAHHYMETFLNVEIVKS